MAAVARVLGMDRTTLTAALKPLERRGLLRIEPDAEDRRSRRIMLTDIGQGVLAETLPIWSATHAAVEAGLSGIDADQLRMGLRAIA